VNYPAQEVDKNFMHLNDGFAYAFGFKDIEGSIDDYEGYIDI